MLFSILSLSHFRPGTRMAQGHLTQTAPRKKMFQYVTCDTDGTVSIFGLARMSASRQSTKLLAPDYRGFVREINLSFLKWAEASPGKL